MTKREFQKRHYHHLREVLADFKGVFRHRHQIKEVMHHQRIDAAFRERLMLAVTAVNGCRYCSYFHARQALASGMSTEEIETMREGAFEGCPAEELPAIMYAQHWAESGSNPEPAVRQQVLERYGEDTLNGMELLLRMISMGNLMGNTFDYVLFRLHLTGADAKKAPAN